MATVEFLEGNKVRVAELFTRTTDSVAVDPGVVIFKHRIGQSGTITTLTYLTDVALVKDSVGNYHVDIDLTTPGMLYWEWRGTGTNQAADEGKFEVAESRFA